MLSSDQSLPPLTVRPCMPIVTVPSAWTVIWPTTAVPSGAASGFIKKTAPSSAVIPSVAVHEAKSMPAEESGTLPSVMPIVSHESYCRSAESS